MAFEGCISGGRRNTVNPPPPPGTVNEARLLEADCYIKSTRYIIATSCNIAAHFVRLSLIPGEKGYPFCVEATAVPPEAEEKARISLEQARDKSSLKQRGGVWLPFLIRHKPV